MDMCDVASCFIHNVMKAAYVFVKSLFVDVIDCRVQIAFRGDDRRVRLCTLHTNNGEHESRSCVPLGTHMFRHYKRYMYESIGLVPNRFSQWYYPM